MYDGRLLHRVYHSGMVDEVVIHIKGGLRVRGRWTREWHDLEDGADWERARLVEQEAAKTLRVQLRELGQRLRWRASA